MVAGAGEVNAKAQVAQLPSDPGTLAEIQGIHGGRHGFHRSVRDPGQGVVRGSHPGVREKAGNLLVPDARPREEERGPL